MRMATAEEPPPLFVQTLLSCLFTPLPPPLSLLFTYSFTLSFHLLGGLPLLFRTLKITQIDFFTNSFLSIPSVWPNHMRLFLFTHSATPHFTLLVHVPMTDLLCMPALVSPSCLFTPHAPLRQLISITRTPDCCALPCAPVSDSYTSIERGILLLQPRTDFSHL